MPEFINDSEAIDITLDDIIAYARKQHDLQEGADDAVVIPDDKIAIAKIAIDW